MNSSKVFLPLLAGWLVTITASAQTYSIDWYKVAGGGGTSTGGTYTVSGTIGQPDAGVMSGGNYSLVGGFWAIISAVQTPGGPRLTITLTGTNTVVVSWPSPSTRWILEQNLNMGAPNWATNNQSVTDNGVTRSIVVNPPQGNLFFRLKQ
jgi:hypothetical protein